MISAEPPSSYVVQAGDTLSGIAGKVYGNVDIWPEICAANRPQIQDCNTIYPGMRLKLPSRHSSGKLAETTGYVARHSNGRFSGTLSCSGLEQLWTFAGGRPSAAFIAAEIAMAESGGNQFATGAAGERGYWQINPDHGSLSTYNPDGNAHAAIVISYDGTNWSAWTTYTQGLYVGRCLGGHIETKTEARRRLLEWRGWFLKRDQLVYDAWVAGLSKAEIHAMTDLHRETIDKIIGRKNREFQEGTSGSLCGHRGRCNCVLHSRYSGYIPGNQRAGLLCHIRTRARSGRKRRGIQLGSFPMSQQHVRAFYRGQ